MSEEKEEKHVSKVLWFVLGALVVILVVQGGLGLAIWVAFDGDDRGIFGDMFGAVNTLFSGLAFVGVIYAIILQSQELTEQRKELQLTRQELKQTAGSQLFLAQEQLERSYRTDLSELAAAAIAASSLGHEMGYRVAVNENQDFTPSHLANLKRIAGFWQVHAGPVTSVLGREHSSVKLLQELFESTTSTIAQRDWWHLNEFMRLNQTPNEVFRGVRQSLVDGMNALEDEVALDRKALRALEEEPTVS